MVHLLALSFINLRLLRSLNKLRGPRGNIPCTNNALQISLGHIAIRTCIYLTYQFENEPVLLSKAGNSNVSETHQNYTRYHLEEIVTCICSHSFIVSRQEHKYIFVSQNYDALNISAKKGIYRAIACACTYIRCHWHHRPGGLHSFPAGLSKLAPYHNGRGNDGGDGSTHRL